MASHQKVIPRGTLIAIEGLDRAGKSTQCGLLLERLQREGRKARLQKFPGMWMPFPSHHKQKASIDPFLLQNDIIPLTVKSTDRTTAIGKMIDSYLKSTSQLEDHSIHLLFSANRWELAQTILADINNGITIIVDRYVYSGVVFSAAKGLDYEYCRTPDTGLPRPDTIIFLDLSAADAAKRGGFGEERYEVPKVQRRVRELFGFMMEDKRDEGDWKVVDAGKSIEEVQEEILGLVRKAEEFAKENGLRSIG